jgi:hypothetical protein
MGLRPTQPRRFSLELEALEQRLVLTAPQLTVPLDPSADRYGDQIVTIQAYQDSSRAAYSIFDTGATALTFSAHDQAVFAGLGHPIPIKIPGGAHGQGYNGPITGDVSQPGTIMATGLGSTTVTLNPSGAPNFNAQFGAGSAAVPGAQAFVGTEDGSPNMPTVTGTPILYGGTSGHPGPYAALVNMNGANFDFTSTVPGLQLSLPNLSFVDPGTQLSAGQDTTQPITIPMVLVGPAYGTAPNGVTQAPSPVQNSVTVGIAGKSVAGRSFLFDTGAQVTVISTALAQALGLDLTHPTTTTSVTGANGSTQAPGFVLSTLDLPTADGQTIEFTNVPVSVLDVGAGIDGILGMNLWDHAVQMLYVQVGPGGPSLTVTFYTNPPPQPPGGSGNLDPILGPLGGAEGGNNLPGVNFYNGMISGKVYYDYNANGSEDGGELGIANQIVYLDMHGSGHFDLGDPSVITDPAGNYTFAWIAPGTYTVKELPSPSLVVVSPASDAITVQVAANAGVTGVDFGDQPTQSGTLAGFVASLYGQILDRAPDQAGLNGWSQVLSQGGPAQSVVQGIWMSTEHLNQEVAGIYQTILHRAADAGGLASWVHAIQQNGISLTDVKYGLLSSTEFQLDNGDNASFVLALYQDVLQRNPDAAGAATWIQNLNAGMSRSQAVKEFLSSDEYYLRSLDSFYVNVLHRQPDQAGERAWLQQLQQKLVTLDAVEQAFLSSYEFLNWSNRNGS